MRVEIVICGLGGQGIQLMGEVLARALFIQGREVAFKSNYGPEARGGYSVAQITIKQSSDDWPEVMEPDILVALAQGPYDLWISRVAPSSLVFFNCDLVKPNSMIKLLHIPVPATQIAQQANIGFAVNIVMLGTVIALTEIVPASAIAAALRAMGVRNMDANLRALKLGQDYAQLIHKAFASYSAVRFVVP